MVSNDMIATQDTLAKQTAERAIRDFDDPSTPTAQIFDEFVGLSPGAFEHLTQLAAERQAEANRLSATVKEARIGHTARLDAEAEKRREAEATAKPLGKLTITAESPDGEPTTVGTIKVTKTVIEYEGLTALDIELLGLA